MLPTKDDFGWSDGEALRAAEIDKLGLRWGDSVSGAPAIPMLQPIERVPRNGKVIMVYCPGETPEHVAAVWCSAENEDGGIAWEGLMFAEPMLADVCPLGPQNATHWYYPPTLDTRAQPHDGGKVDADTFRKEYEATFVPRAPHEQFTLDQRQVLAERGLRAEDVKIFWDQEVESESISDFTSGPILDTSTIRRVIRRPCPVLTDFRPKSNDAYVVWPDGSIGLAQWREGSE
ncbi:hypothetical protein [Sphingomonas sp. ACRSK]|uniref:hypothetical protein n=1 Tax=Sphingomonas sp. ACRSK TaxID=2918213 RepID=UPI001EF4D0B5|nr:hypothetical protein [Sphingomonas sp. ACRSK]MCG7348814.1 hypothetical protein [Sphingomonas sp. ACRSK]